MGTDLPAFFDRVYRERSRYCVVFVSQECADRMWTNHERQAAVARHISQRAEDYILPIQVDDARLAGVPPTIGRVSLETRSIDEIADLLIKKLAASRR